MYYRDENRNFDNIILKNRNNVGELEIKRTQIETQKEQNLKIDGILC